MGEEFDAIDELGKAAHMPPKSTRDVLIVDLGRIAELEAEVERLRDVLRVYADPRSWDGYDKYIGSRWIGCNGGSIARAALEPQP